IERTLEEVDAAFKEIVEALRDWLAEPSPSIRETHIATARVATFNLIDPRDLGLEKKIEIFRFLVHVTSV
ncbi:hypothetical protein, partial [Stenotrophomonas maltophilia]|uniref:hypothetical protein n=1 Tax=Stenotrophomonas maltophilia TaxID=40324 RepID=UPI0013D95CAF